MSGTLFVRCHEPPQLSGEITPPPDKSITIRALILGMLAEGETRILNPLNALDTRSALLGVQQLGAMVYEREREWVVMGGELRTPPGPVDLGNSGTALRLLTGALAGRPGVDAVLTGDESLRSRPMARVVEPLGAMGAEIEYLEKEGCAPLRVRGRQLKGMRYELPVPSAQVKSAVLLAGLGAQGATEVVERLVSRDHTELMLPRFGVPLEIVQGGGRRLISLTPPEQLAAAEVQVPGDISSAFLWVVLGLLLGEKLALHDVGLNTTRLGALRVLSKCSGGLTVHIEGRLGAEGFGRIHTRKSLLAPFDVPPAEIPAMVDELPLLALAATQARGESTIRGAGELRVKESDRLARTAEILRAFGADVEVHGESMRIAGPQRLRPAEVDSGGDHRMAMLGLACALVAGEGESRVRDFTGAEVSYPGLLADARKAVEGAEFGLE
jgi:3-phosphoshikimate 1-carboxyvinyltransferase